MRFLGPKPWLVPTAQHSGGRCRIRGAWVALTGRWQREPCLCGAVCAESAEALAWPVLVSPRLAR